MLSGAIRLTLNVGTPFLRTVFGVQDRYNQCFFSNTAFQLSDVYA
ncbi:hypothetical protein HDF22_004896 [Mucilaginibacter lappiensis]|uniref:Uncharacterized protein n=1 Tax=Mucilaginibacter lappiensis TaxID=354630 RepID=A0A841JSC5_9SPHI|nr:hypothetical protein [Mucilaginibacter lappiensis]